MTKIMKMICGTDFGHPRTGRTSRTWISALESERGFYGIRNKETGEIHVPSVYYVEFCRGESVLTNKLQCIESCFLQV